MRWLSLAALATLAACGPSGHKGAENSASHTSGMNHMSMASELDKSRPDRSFAEQMIPHHQGAIAMAQQELRLGKDPEMRRLATKIIADQEREIAELQAWLAKAPE